jgi:hypothetical protein
MALTVKKCGASISRLYLAVLIWTLVCWTQVVCSEELSERFEADSNAKAGSFNSYYADFSLTFSALAPFYESGPKLKFTAAESWYSYPGNPGKTFISKGRDSETDFLFGYGFSIAERYYLLLFAGPAVVWSVQKPGDLSESSETTRAGVKMEGSLYAEPTDQTMLYTQASYSTANNAFYTEAKFGWELAPSIYLGPEVAFLGGGIFGQSNPESSTTYQQWRAGGFISGPTVGLFRFGLSAGYLRDRQQGNGAYIGTSARVAF